MEKNLQKLIDEGILYYTEWAPGVYVVHTKKEISDIMEQQWGTDITSVHDIIPEWIRGINRKYRDIIVQYNKDIDKYC